MTTAPFWIEHFAKPDPIVHQTFVALTPSDCDDLLDDLGICPTKITSHESVENRVFGFDDVVLKFYRPGRWSEAALEDEVDFLEDLRQANVPFARPIGGVGTWRGIHYLAFESVPGPFQTDPETLTVEQVRQMVHLLARIHDVGAKRPAKARPYFKPAQMCEGCFEVICRAGFLPKTQQGRYREAFEALVAAADGLEQIPQQRIHGDCFSGNALWRADGPVFIDLDDFQMGPVLMDIPLLSFPWRLDTLPPDMDRKARRAEQNQLVLQLYRQVRPFDPKWEPLIPLMTGYRSVVFDAWFSANWDEPGFAEQYDEDNLNDPKWWEDAIQGMERLIP